jgi:hypothetical protein
MVLKNFNSDMRKIAASRSSGNFCSACRGSLEPEDLFCPRCGPPLPPDDDIETGITFFQALLRIFALALIFGLIMFFKLDIKFNDVTSQMPDLTTKGASGKSESDPKSSSDKNFELVYAVNVPLANVRDKPSTENSQVIFKVPGGVHVNVLREKDQWAEIQFEGKTGWVLSKLLVRRVK